MNKHYGSEGIVLHKIYGFTQIGACLCWALSPQGQGLLHWIQVLQFLSYENGFTLNELVYLMNMFRLLKLK
jgi:hypothetical protein